MDNVVYILGAGFSAPLRLPVVSNFLERAKDLYQSNTAKYEHFERVFEGIKKMGYVPLYYQSDLTNIEEILSILEMERLCGNFSQEETDDFIRFIKDVIEGFTPFVTENATIYNYKWIDKGIYRSRGTSQDWEVESACYPETDDPDDNWHAYGNFVLRLFHAKLKAVPVEGEYPNIHRLDEDIPHEHKPTDFEVFCQFDTSPSTNYSVITLNYDMVLENFAEHFSSFTSSEELKFSRPSAGLREGFPMLVKLHGSVDDGTVIPPTWNKSLHPKIEQEWRHAYKLLSSANHICILGYSLPENDAYVRYLLKSSLMETGNLKTIDVVCVDNDGTVKKRYDLFISLKYPKYRFINAKVQAFLPFVHSYPITDGVI
jgi:SIR2-like domain